MAHEIQRAVSIATIRPSKAGFYPVVSHMFGEEWALHTCDTQAEAQRYVNAIWAGVKWLTPAGFKAAMHEPLPGTRAARWAMQRDERTRVAQAGE